MKLAELFEEPLAIDKVTPGKIFLRGPRGIDMSVDLDKTGGTDWVIDPRTGDMTPEPSEATETKLALGLIGQIGDYVSIREQPFPADPKMYMIATNEQLAAARIQLPAKGHADLIDSGSLYILDPKNIGGIPKKIILKNYRVVAQDGSIALERERGPAQQAQLARNLQRLDIPLNVGG